MNKYQYNKVYAFIVFSMLIILFSSMVFFVNSSNEERMQRLGDSVISDFQAGLDYEMVDLLSFSMALSEDSDLKNALVTEDESQGHHTLKNIAEKFRKHTHLKYLRIQVLTPDFFIFSRSWDEGFEGMPLWWFRNDLEVFREKKKPKVGMETGRLLTLKATVPIRSKEEIIGYIEGIKLIDEFVFKLRKKGIELYAFMSERHLDIAELMRGFTQVNGYILANQNANQQLINNIRMLNWEELEENKYLYVDDILYLCEPMYNGQKEKIGVYILALSEQALSNYENNKGVGSFFAQFSDKSIAQVVESWYTPYGSFSNEKDYTLFTLLPTLEQEDRLRLKNEALISLQKYTKDELIDIILSNKYNEKKVGKIQ